MDNKANTRTERLTHSQQAVYLDHMIHPNIASYNVGTLIHCQSPFEEAQIRQTIHEISGQHDMLRTCLVQDGADVRQLVNEHATVDIRVIDRSEGSISDGDIESLISDNHHDCFNLFSFTWRVTVIKIGENDWKIAFSGHHLFFDGLSIIYIYEAFMELFPDIRRGSKFKDSSIQSDRDYWAYVDEDKQYTQSPRYEKDKTFWQNKFRTVPDCLLPTLVSGVKNTHESTFERVFIPRKIYKSIEDAVESIGLSMAHFAVAVTAVYFARVKRQKDIVIGIPIHNRTKARYRRTMGMFASMMPLRINLDASSSFLTLMTQIAKEMRACFRHQRYPIVDINRLCQLTSLGRPQLFDVSVSYERKHVSEEYSFGIFKGATIPLRYESTPAALAFKDIYESDDVGLELNCNNAHIAPAETLRICSRLRNIILDLHNNLDAAISTLPLIDDEEERYQTHELNKLFFTEQSHLDTSNSPLVHERVVAHAATDSTKLAVIYRPINGALQTFTYGELVEASANVANFLLQNGHQGGDLVAVFVERNARVLPIILGVLRAGCAFLPLAPETPLDRVNQILNAGKCRAVIVDNLEKRHTSPPDYSCQSIESDVLLGFQSVITTQLPVVTGQQPAYVTFTSGSTGEPKGVKVSHSAIESMYRAWHAAYALDTFNDRMLQMANINFDVFTGDWVRALCSGNTLVLCDRERLFEPELLLDELVAMQVTFAEFVPAVLRTLIDECVAKNTVLPALRTVIVGSDSWYQTDSFNFFKVAAPSTSLINSYGITETTVDSTWFHVDRNSAVTSGMAPIGRPFSNTCVYILDEFGQTIPQGEVGELHIGGAGVSDGYINLPAQTDEKFIPNRFLNDGSRLYRSGDMVRYLPDGCIEYIGRSDYQVKVNGYRIELAEIERALCEIFGIKQAVAVGYKANEKKIQLVAYIEWHPKLSDTEYTIDSVKLELAKVLPKYMIPTLFLEVEHWPLSANGKVDRKALPEPQVEAISQNYVAPTTPEEKQLANLWANLFGVAEDKVSAHANFFEMGGDSILCIQLISRAAASGYKLTIKKIFEHQTLSELAKHIELGERTEISQDAVDGSLQLTPIQTQFFDNKTDLHHYNQSALLRLASPVSHENLLQVVRSLYVKHDSFRLRFNKTTDGDWQGRYSFVSEEEITACVTATTLTSCEQAELLDVCNNLHRSLDLETGPLIRFAAIQQPRDGLDKELSGYLFIAAHHLIVDGVSWRILIEEIASSIAACASGHDILLQPKTHSFKDWGDYLNSTSLADLEFWDSYATNEFTDLLSYVDKDWLSSNETQSKKSVIRQILFELSGSSTEQLLKDVGAPYSISSTEILLAALHLCLYKMTGAPDIAIDIEHHGRDVFDHNFDFSQTVGWFTSVYPHVFSVPETLDELDLESWICFVKESLRSVPDKGAGYGVRRYIHNDAPIDIVSRIAFNFLGQLDQSLSSPIVLSLDENYGEVVSPMRSPDNSFTFNCWIKKSQLHVVLDYDALIFNELFVENFYNTYVKCLESILDFCAQKRNIKLTPSDLPLCDLDIAELNQWQSAYSFDDQYIRNIYPATKMQAGMLFHHLFDAANYHTQLLVTLEGALSTKNFKAAWQTVFERHDALRTVLNSSGGGEWYQIILEGKNIPWHYEDLSSLSAPKQRAEIERFKKDDKRLGFDLEQGPLIRVAVWKTADATHEVLWSQHHIVSDGWSLPVILSELMTIYGGFVSGSPTALAPAPAYADFISWQRANDFTAAQQYWRNSLADHSGPTQLPGQRATSFDQHHDAADLTQRRVSLSVEQTARLVEFTREKQITMNTVLQAVWAYVLAGYSNESSVTFGLTTSGRPAELLAVEQTVGLFINTVPVRIEVEANCSLEQWLVQLQQQQLDRQQHSDLPYMDIRSLAPDGSQSNLFNSLLVFENYPSIAALDDMFKESGLNVSAASNDEDTSFPLTLVVTLGDQLSIDMRYLQAGFDHEILVQAQEALLNLLIQCATGSTARVSDLSLVTEHDRHKLVHDFNSTVSSFPDSATVVSLFEDQVTKSYNHIAIIVGQQSLTYGELDEQSNRLAIWLVEKGVGKDTPVGLACYRSVELVVGLWAIMKAGGAYVPLEPDFPNERLQDVIEVSGLSLVLTHSQAAVQLHGVETVCLNEISFKDSLRNFDAQYKLCRTAPENLAYILFTSGSTGKPKGVMIEHRALVNRIDWMQKQYPLDQNDRVLQKTPFSFDVSVWEFVWPMLTGAVLVVARPDGHKDPAYMAALCQEHQVTTLHFVPSMLRVMLESGSWGSFRSVRQVFCSGEALTTDLVDAHFEQHHALLHNLYGPTEAAIDVSFYECNTAHAEGGKRAANVPIGKPIQNIQLYVLGRQCQILPVGAIGELYIGGIGLARGYVNRDDLTTERFVTIELPDKGYQRLYRTGDLATVGADGVINYLGRIDDQIKIRGLRIELSEIEAKLQHLDDVLTSAVIVTHDPQNQPRIVAYVVTGVSGFDSASIRTSLLNTLPEYMVPEQIVAIEALPLTPNGKLDRKALPKVSFQRDAKHYIKPSTSLAADIANVWSALLKINAELISADDDFFKLGGHSLLAIRLLTELRTQFFADISIRDIYAQPKLQQLADWIGERTAGAESQTLTVPSAKDWNAHTRIPSSFAQQRIWFLNQLGNSSNQYHLLAAIDVRGQFSLDAAQWALNEIVQRHSILQARYIGEAENVYLELRQENPVPFAKIEADVDLSPESTEITKIIDAFVNTPFDLSNDVLLRAAWVSFSATSGLMLLNMHHIAFDGWSITVIADEFQALYSAYVDGSKAQLPDLPMSYFDFAAWQREFLNSNNPSTLGQLNYWKTALAGIPDVHGVPTDFAREPNQQHKLGTESLLVKNSVLETLETVAKQQEISLYMLLHAAFSMVLARYSNERDIVIGMPVAGRVHPGLDSLIGMFVNTLVLRTQYVPEQDFIDYLKSVKEVHIAAQENQDIPFEWLVEELNPTRSAFYSPVIQIMLSMNTNQPIDIQLSNLDVTLHDGFRYASNNSAGPSSLDLDAKFELLLNAEVTERGLLFNFEYSRALWDQHTIQNILASLSTVLESVENHIEQPNFTLPLVAFSEVEQEKITSQLKADYSCAPSILSSMPSVGNIVSQFELMVSRHPNHVALSCGENQISYCELNARANRLAHYLLAKGVGPSVKVGISMHRSCELYIAMLAVVKTGAAYVPLDKNYPADRLAYMIEDSGIFLLLHNGGVFNPQGTSLSGLTQLDYNTILNELDSQPEVNPSITVEPEDLAYINYTSGSTGNPKGVLTPHRGIYRLVVDCDFMPLNEATRFLQISSVSFDAATLEIWGPLLNGGCLVAYPDLKLDIDNLNALLKTERINSLWLTSALFDLWSFASSSASVDNLRWLLAGGDVLNPRSVARAYALMPELVIINGYGPTENTTFTCCYRVPRNHPDNQSVPLGFPINGTEVFVLDDYRQQVPIGAIGELYTAGVGVALGYLNKPDLTSLSFIEDPNVSNFRLYRTGDLVRYNAKGEIEFIGRVDNQVKIRGYRIEPGEIQRALEESDLVKSAVVLIHGKDSAEKELAAYFVNSDPVGEKDSSDQVRTYLRKKLPEHMVPTYFISVDKIPVNINGKVDRSALPSISAANAATKGEAPTTTTELALAELWSRLLKVPLASIHTENDFFDLGGHSLLSIKLQSEIRETFDVEIPIVTVFEASRFRTMAANIEILKSQHSPEDLESCEEDMEREIFEL
ncbi:amino acid adenylation domain-containing protein [Teredinibacter turnerae]|uniref:amino acid adenylation domain-containing protein n=1 Tax=Teredinibacter turnerae TaxID=2426 RepID=UPI0030D009BF